MENITVIPQKVKHRIVPRDQLMTLGVATGSESRDSGDHLTSVTAAALPAAGMPHLSVHATRTGRVTVPSQRGGPPGPPRPGGQALKADAVGKMNTACSVCETTLGQATSQRQGGQWGQQVCDGQFLTDRTRVLQLDGRDECTSL